MQMRSIAITLKKDQDIADVTAYVSTLQSETPKATMEGDIVAGKTLMLPVLPVMEQTEKVTKPLTPPRLQDYRIGISQDSLIILRSVPEVD